MQSRLLEFVSLEVKLLKMKARLDGAVVAAPELIQARAVLYKRRRASTARYSHNKIYIRQYTGHYITVVVLSRELSQSKLDFSTVLFNTLMLLFGELSNGHMLQHHLLSDVKRWP